MNNKLIVKFKSPSPDSFQKEAGSVPFVPLGRGTFQSAQDYYSGKLTQIELKKIYPGYDEETDTIYFYHPK